MKRTALFLAAAVLGTGCIVVDDDDCSTPSLAVEWSFQLSDGSVVGCAAADVVDVDVYLNGQFVATYPCTQGGATITGVGAGNHALVVEGIDSALRIAYRDSRTVAAGECGTRLVSARPAEGTVNLDYSVATAPTACSTSPCFLWFSVFDEVAGTVAAVIGDTSPASVKDDFLYPDDVVIRLAAGTYTLEWMELVSRPGGVYTGERITCEAAGIGFDVAAALVTAVPLDLACVPQR